MFFLKYNNFSLFSILWIPLIYFFHFVAGPKIIIYFIVCNRARQKGQRDSSLGQPDFYQPVARWATWFFFELLRNACSMMSSSNGNIFPITGPLCGEFTSHWWIPLTKASDRELWWFVLIYYWTKSWVNNRYAGDLRHHHTHYDFTVMRCPHVRMRLELEMQFIMIWMHSLYFILQVS